MLHRTDFGGFLVGCYKAIQQLNGVEKNSVAIRAKPQFDWTTVDYQKSEWPFYFFTTNKTEYWIYVQFSGVFYCYT